MNYKTKIVDGTAYHAETPLNIVHALESVRASGERVRLFYGDVKTGKSWLDEWDMMGRISRSTGSMRIPILIKNSRANGGFSILDNCIIGIKKIKTGRWIYKHPNFNIGNLEMFEIKDIGKNPQYLYSVLRDGQNHANFETKEKAEKWVAFMKGERFTK